MIDDQDQDDGVSTGIDRHLKRAFTELEADVPARLIELLDKLKAGEAPDQRASEDDE